MEEDGGPKLLEASTDQELISELNYLIDTPNFWMVFDYP